MDIKIVFHPSGDWEGLYLEGELQAEGHSIQVEDLVNALNNYGWDYEKNENSDYNLINFKYSTRDLGSEEEFDEDFSFPLKYEDIDKERLKHSKEKLQAQIDKLTKELESL